MNISDARTGDLVLFHGTGLISYALEYFGKSRYSHVGIILVNPTYLCETLNEGVYVWDASYTGTPDAENHTIRFGVHIHKWADIVIRYEPHAISIRRIHMDRDDAFERTLTLIHQEVHAKPYDLHPLDWICGMLNLYIDVPTPKHTDRFWCSALVAYVYYRLGWISNVNWSVIAPREFSKSTTRQLVFTCIIDDEREVSVEKVSTIEFEQNI